MFDTVCKFLAETFSADFASWLLGESIVLTELSPTELSLEPIRADALMLLQSDEVVQHVEFQIQPAPNIAFRMLDYRVRIYRRFPHKRVRQVVIYLQETGSEWVQQTSFSIPGNDSADSAEGNHARVSDLSGYSARLQQGLLILCQLIHRVGEISPERQGQIEGLSLTQLENLGEALLDFECAEDLMA